MKKIISFVIWLLLLTWLYSSVNAWYQESVNKVMDNYYSKIDNKSYSIKNKVNKLETLQNKISKLKLLKWDKLSKKNEEILSLILNSLEKQINYYKEQIIYNETNKYQLSDLKNWDKVAIMDTNMWAIKIKLFDAVIPRTTLNFIGLAQNGNYSWLTFHRVINNFMIQWGDPTGTGMWWNSIYWEKFKDEFSDKLSNIPWSVSMANSWENTNWSQFFINQVSNTFLDSNHTVFWQVIEWLNIVNNIAKVDVDKITNKPINDVIINTIIIKEFKNNTLVDYKIDIEKEIKELEKNELIIKELKAEENKNRSIKKWDKVKVNYTLTLENWELIDSSYDNSEAFEFIVGQDWIIPIFNSIVIWMKINTIKTVTIPPNEWYGEYNDSNTQTVLKSELKSFIDAGIKLEVWNILTSGQGNYKILSVTEKDITVDMNHPLAWKNLIFKIEFINFLD